MYPGAGFLDDDDTFAKPSSKARKIPPLLTKGLAKGVGHSYLDSDSDDDNEPLSSKRGDQQAAKSLFVSPVHQMISSPTEPAANEGRFRTEFQHIARLGRGGFGSVDLVRNKLDRGLYAVKKIRFKRKRRDGKLGKKLMREILAMNELSHPNIVRYHGSWIEDDVTPHGTPSSSAERHVKLFEFDDSSNEDDEKAKGEDGDEYGEDDDLEDEDVEDDTTESGVVNADDDDDESVEGDESSTTTTNDGSISGCSPFRMEDDEKEPRRGRKKKRAPPSPRVWTYGTLYIQMQYYEETLDAWLDSPGRKNHVCCHVSRDIFMQIVEALHYIHRKGYIHRDLKPANIFLTPRKEEGAPVSGDVCKCEVCGAAGCGRGFIVHIGDFGLTTLSQDPKTIENNSPTEKDEKPLTKSDDHVYSGALPLVKPVPIPSFAKDSPPVAAASVGCLFRPGLVGSDEHVIRSRSRSNSSLASRHTTGVGSLSYASPEQINGQFYDEKTDVFSLGIICYQLFSPPFFTRMERAKEFGSLRAGRIPQAFASAHPREADLIRSCVAAVPEDRPSTTDILAMDIWEPAQCMCLRDSSYAVTIPRSMFKRMQDEITRLQQELAQAKEQLAKYNPPLSPTPLDSNNGHGLLTPRRNLSRSRLQPTRNADLPNLFGP